MRISEYPYGRITKTLKKACKWINQNYLRILRNKEKLGFSEEKGWDIYAMRYAFDYPDYLFMPKQISYRLNTDEVDWLQEGWYDLVDRYIYLKNLKKEIALEVR